MAVAVTLRLDATAAARVADLCGILAARGISDYADRLGYHPHLTLVRGDDIDIAAGVLVLRDFAARLSRIRLHLEVVSVFPGNSSVLWLALVDSRALRATQAALHRVIAPLIRCETYSSPRLWIPHITLAEGLSETALGAALDAVLPCFRARTRISELSSVGN